MNDAAHDVRARDACPRCGAALLHAWDELSEDEREVVRRLPASADFTFDERARRHRWCVRCWQEETGSVPRTT
jgi:hypothetical protein